MILRPVPAGVELVVQARPRAGRSEIAGPHGDALRVRLAAPPAEGAANQELVELLARTLGVPRSGVELLRGSTGRRKLLRIRGVTVQEARERLGL